MMYNYDLTSWLRYRLDRRDCGRILKKGSRSFFAASLLLPKEYRIPIVALYAFCREADDAIDCSDNPDKGLEGLFARLKRIYDREPQDSAVDRAFAHVVHKHGIPYALPAALFEGFAWDVGRRDYQTLSDVYAYSARVAGTVGSMMAVIMGARRPEVLSRACDLGVAMQLTNIARDVGEDARAGRVYLPIDMLEQRGIDVEKWRHDPVACPEVADVVAEVLQRAETLYKRSEWGITKLPASCRPAIFAARLIYAEIGREIEARQCDSVSSRAVVGGSRKLALLSRAMLRSRERGYRESAPTLEEVRFLVDAVSAPS